MLYFGLIDGRMSVPEKERPTLVPLSSAFVPKVGRSLKPFQNKKDQKKFGIPEKKAVLL